MNKEFIEHSIPKHARFIDISSRKYSRLMVVSYAGKINNLSAWNCVCLCGTKKIVRSSDLQSGQTKSCGCLHREISADRLKTHGKRGIPEYNIWARMIQRCTNSNDRRFNDYGNRGITVCDRWVNSFENFYEDIGDRPSSGHSIDRIDNNGNYEPNNCKWSTQTEQNRNQRIRKNNKTGVKGVSISKSGKFSATIGINYKLIRLGLFDNIEDAAKARKQAELIYWNCN